MKKITAFLLLGLAVSLASCGSEKEQDDNRWFLTPEAAVSGTTVEMTCRTRFAAGALDGVRVGFTYASIVGGVIGPFAESADCRVEGSSLVSTLNGLLPETVYAVYAFADLPTGRVQSPAGSFRTGKGFVNPDLAKYAGWAELPAVQGRPGDCYYAVHYCDGAPGGRNYTVCYSAGKRSGMWSAFPLHDCYKGTQGRTDDWFYDPAIPEIVQPDLIKGSYKPQPGYSKGHLLASNDRTASYAINAQTFYVTNVAPQWQNSFNSGVWSSLEDDCWKNVCADTLYVVSGVWFADDDTTVTDQSGDVCIVPTNFYRVLMRSKSGSAGKPLRELAADEIECVGFWFENRAYPSGKPSQYMTSVADIEAKTQIEFFTNVPDAPKEKLNPSFWNFR